MKTGKPFCLKKKLHVYINKRHEKTRLRGFRGGPTQIGLFNTEDSSELVISNNNNYNNNNLYFLQNLKSIHLYTCRRRQHDKKRQEHILYIRYKM